DIIVRIAVYPGSFDPVTCGHLDIAKRASKIFDKVIMAVLVNPGKNPMFSVEERKKLLQEVVKEYDNIEVDSFEGLLVDYIEENNYNVIVKGLRAISDFEAELQMASMNHKLNTEIETLFMMTATEYSYLSSSLVKEVFKFNGSIDGLVPEYVKIKMKAKNEEEFGNAK
ncbi:MAG: pantetheine-phosphate adenylyltransferase, partial [Acidaminobacteraceae bacterium]